MKKCSKCTELKTISEFPKNKKHSDGLSYLCRACSNEVSRNWRLKNKEKVANVKKQWYIKNKDKVIEYSKKYYRENDKQIIAKIVHYRSNKLKTDPIFKLRKLLCHRLNKLIFQQKSSIAVDFLGCELSELKAHLESKFQPGMSWDNYGQWHIDHIVPLSSFNLKDVDELKKACHYSNLQPLWAKDNLSKGNKLV